MSRRTQKNVGVIGLGIIGRRVADNLRRRGFQVFVWNRTPRPYPNFVGSPSELAELCDFVQIFVSDDEALLQMVQQMKPALSAQHVIMAHSTVAPHTMRNAAEFVQRRGAHFLDAPFTGSKVAAEKAELVYYVAGDDAAYKRARAVLQASSKEIIEIGEIGQATTVKIATNMVTAATVQAAAEALALVHHSGLGAEKLAAALRGNASNSGTLTMKLPKMIEGDFDPHFSVKHMLKDVQIAARMARSYGLTLGATEAARDSLLDEADSGRADQDFCSLVRFFFPEGLPGEISQTAEGGAQQTLNGVDEEAAAQVRPVERPPTAEPRAEAAPAERKAEEALEASAEIAENDEVTDRAAEDRRDETSAEIEQAPAKSPDLDEPDAPAEAALPSDDDTVQSATRPADQAIEARDSERDSVAATQDAATQDAATQD
ncbi:MAG TPA: NAD(P)-dependent oxidoreductase, partial [Chthoniobacterales bacterium]|nr:NAD(P)-dependent oxidoreductase [Chthoniobacterales bacterium]